MCAYAEISGLGRDCTLSYVVLQIGVCCFGVHSLIPVISLPFSIDNSDVGFMIVSTHADRLYKLHEKGSAPGLGGSMIDK
jgi:hypothetical protein